MALTAGRTGLARGLHSNVWQGAQLKKQGFGVVLRMSVKMHGYIEATACPALVCAKLHRHLQLGCWMITA